ncbi:phage P2 LysB-like protein [Ectopseudomonas mendocina NK-01]|nr:phage P2 LysB-like protein [Pseudomonas mendocina NK-01]
MTTLRQSLYGLALLGALALLLWSTYQQHQADKARAERDADRITNLQQRSARQAASIIRMGNELAAQRAAQQDMQTAQADVRQQHATSQIQKQEISRNDPSFSDWGRQPLPSAARRLHERPALTGASGYRAWLSRRNALQPAASGAAQ